MITSWSPSRLSLWEDCARKAQYQIVQKLCPSCFGGKLGGPWGEPQVCDACGVVEETPAAIARGTMLHAEAEKYLRYGGKAYKELINVLPLLKLLRKDFKKGLTTIEDDLVFLPDWTVVDKFTKGAWLRTKLDVLTIDDDNAEVIDWKSGGIDKRTGEIRAEKKYDDQLSIYATAVLSAFPKVKTVTAILAFIDGPLGRNEVVSGGTAHRRDLPKLQAKWAGRARGLLSDTIFAPRPSFTCRYCPYSKQKNGPCAF